MSINWTTYEYPGNLTSEERIEWFTGIGFDKYFTFWNTAVEGQFRLYSIGNKSGSNNVYVTMDNMQNKYSNDDYPYISGAYAYLNGGSSSTWSVIIGSKAYYTKGSKIYFDKAVLGDVVVIKIRQMSTNYGEKSVVFAFDTKAVELSTNAEKQLTFAGTPISNYDSNPEANAKYYMISIEGHTSPPKYYGNNGLNVYVETDNYNTDKYILRPFFVEGVQSNLWTIDGGQAHPAIYQSIVINNHEFYTLGQGLAIKVS
jgi:hypothetical protein